MTYRIVHSLNQWTFDKGLVTNYGEGGYKTGGWGGGHVKFNPYEKEAQKCFSHAEVWAQVLG